jgi:DNA-binding transcriptional MerR regulator
MDALLDESLRGAALAGEPHRGAEIVEFLFIGELSRLVGMSPRAIRFYEKEGLIAPNRHGRFRVYHKSDEARLRAIGRLRALGFSVAMVRESLERFLDLQALQNRQEASALLEKHIADQARRLAEIQKEQALALALRDELAG